MIEVRKGMEEEVKQMEQNASVNTDRNSVHYTTVSLTFFLFSFITLLQHWGIKSRAPYMLGKYFLPLSYIPDEFEILIV